MEVRTIQEKLLKEGFLTKRLSDKKGVGMVFVGNVEREHDPVMTWLDPKKPEIEERPDLAIIILAKTGKFTEEEARTFIKKAMQNGQIYERKSGFYAKA